MSTYPGFADSGDRRIWTKSNLGGIPLSGPPLPESVCDAIRVAIHLGKPSKVVLFGSRARGTARSSSDFDILFHGLQDRAGFNLARLDVQEGYLTLRQVDMVAAEEASPDLLTDAAKEGITLYEQPS